MNKPYSALQEDEKKRLLFRLLDGVRIDEGRKSLQEMSTEELGSFHEMALQVEKRKCDVSTL
jgi:hypothetical protein